MQTCQTFPLSAAVVGCAEHSLFHAQCVLILVYLKMDCALYHCFTSSYSGKLPDSARHVIGRDSIWSYLRNAFSDPMSKLHWKPVRSGIWMSQNVWHKCAVNNQGNRPWTPSYRSIQV